MSAIAGALSFTRGLLDLHAFTRWTQPLGEIRRGVTHWSDRTAALAGSPPTGVPVTRDGEVWVSADARIDGTEMLTRLLRDAGQDLTLPFEDAHLIIHAYKAWGMEFVQHLLGDFAFVLWDSRRERLIAATDPFGIRRLYYAPVADGVLVSNWARALYTADSVDRSLDDDAVVQFLRQGEMRGGVTAFRGIKVIPGGHVLLAENRRISIRRYWTLPLEEPLSLERPSAYIDAFLELTKAAVADRCRSSSVAVLMSGGLDSTATAALARTVLPSPGQVVAHSNVYRQLIPDDEFRFVRSVVEHLDLPVHYLWADDYTPFENATELLGASPIPLNNPLLVVLGNLFRSASSTAKTALTGHGTDAVLAPEPMFAALRRSGGRSLIGAASSAAVHYRRYGRRPPLGLRNSIGIARGSSAPEPAFPHWLRSEWASHGLETDSGPGLLHPYRPNSYRAVIGRTVPAAVEWFTGLAQLQGMSCTHPFLDLRVVRFCLRLPAVPWCWDKHILREATAGLLSESVRLRAKTPLAADPFRATIQARGSDWIGALTPGKAVRRYYAHPSFAELAPSLLRDATWCHIRPVSLELFFRSWNCA